MATTYISRTTGTGFTSQQKFTASLWFKGDTPPPADMYIWSIGSSGAYVTIYMASNGKVNIVNDGPSFAQYSKVSLKDPSAWYHLVLSIDTTQSTEVNRVKLWVNGTLYADDADWNSRSWPAEDDVLTGLVSGKIQYIGASQVGSPYYLEGLISHVHYCDGYNYTASDFGEVDATSGIWKIKTTPSVTYGNNGYFLAMEDSSNLDLDSGTNAFTFATTGTLTATKDNPSNNFATFNPEDNYWAASTFTNGNNTIVTGASPRYAPNNATMGLASGKWYWETKCTVGGTDSWTQGIQSSFTTSTSNAVGENANDYSYFANGYVYTNGGNSAYGDAYTVDDIIGNYLDLDNNKMYWAKNGTVQNSGTGQSITAAASTVKGVYFPAVSDWSSAQTYTYHLNFGNGYFGTTVITSPEADAGGVGAFKYDPSAGTFDSASKDFRAICTKNIKAYGG